LNILIPTFHDLNECVRCHLTSLTNTNFGWYCYVYMCMMLKDNKPHTNYKINHEFFLKHDYILYGPGYNLFWFGCWRLLINSRQKNTCIQDCSMTKNFFVSSLWVQSQNYQVFSFENKGLTFFDNFLPLYFFVATPLRGNCEDETRTPKSGNLESSRTPETLKLNCKGQNTSPWGVLYTVEIFLKCRCRKWPCMNHSDICSTSYGRKKGQESNW
jgi:hypothetical protein